MNCVLVDDDEMILTSIKRLCEKSGLFSEITAFNDSEKCAQYLFKNTPDVLFVDVEMPGISGLELLKSFDKIKNVIVISGKTEYAFDAYQLHVVDYLPKPVTLPRFLKACEKIKAPAKQDVADTELYVKVDGKLTRVPFNDILFIESLTDYIRINTNNDKLVVYSSLKHIESKLPDKDFIKVHRSFIVNMKKIKDIDESLIVIGSALIPVSRAKQPELIKRLNLLK
ncbi:MAG: LytR/AlgR family response regulator transcription factor [Bacteroidia bacterium]